MRIVSFPGRDGQGPKGEGQHDAWLAELDAALSGTATGPTADSWSELCADVRALALPMDADFERQLAQRIAARGAGRQPLTGSRALAGPRRVLAAPLAALTGRVPRVGRPALAALATAVGALVVALVIVSSPQSGSPIKAPSAAVESAPPLGSRLGTEAASPRNSSGLAAGSGAAASDGAGAAGAKASIRAAQAATAESATPPAAGPAAAPGRVQQLAATLTLGTSPGEVQTIADRVARLSVADGGFVQSSHAQVQQGGASEADLILRVPSERLSVALASLERLAPVRAESQSLQDITSTYDAARQRLADAEAEQKALLRALSRASTQGQIDSLRERLAQDRSAIARARSAVQAVSRRASTAEVEVTVIGSAHAASEGLTLHRGLHDAGRVLTVTLIVLLIAASALVPAALLLAATLAAQRAWRRSRREQALDAS